MVSDYSSHGIQCVSMRGKIHCLLFGETVIVHCNNMEHMNTQI